MQLRKTNLQSLATEKFDVLIVGGGINGAVAAASLAARGAKVALIDKEDFASGVSSQSSNLAWGGIKYMESFELGLVRKLCMSRNRLAALFPSAVREIRFLTVVRKGFRWPAPLVYLGAVLYWLLGSCKTRAPKYLSRAAIQAREPVLDVTEAAGGFEYSDCQFDDNDARFVFNLVRNALDQGAVGANYVRAVASHHSSAGWRVEAVDEVSGGTFDIHAKVLINAAGPYVDEFNTSSNQRTTHKHLFSKGVHLIVDQVTPNRRVLTLFASDGRPFFVIPMGSKTCVGTTDTQVTDPSVGVTAEDRRFILDNVNAGLALAKPLELEDIISERCGVRPLAVADDVGSGDWLQLSRKHALDVDEARAHISIFGGKLTDCLNVGEAIALHVASLGVTLNNLASTWCGEPDEETRRRFFHQARTLNLDDTLDDAMAEGAIDDRRGPRREPPSDRLWRRYGGGAFSVLELIERDPSQAELVLSGYEIMRAELEYARGREMVIRLEDFLRRRTRVAQLIAQDELARDPGLKTVCEVLFGEAADERLTEYLALDRPAVAQRRNG